MICELGAGSLSPDDPELKELTREPMSDLMTTMI
jgi:hypothetical protein